MKIKVNLNLNAKWILLTMVFAFSGINIVAQTTNSLTLLDCYRLAESNYPLSKQKDLIQSSKTYTLQNLAAGVSPQISISGQSTYQSAVTKVTIPGINIPEVTKDQYKLYADVSQTLTDFALYSQQKKLQTNIAGIQEENINTELYKLKDRINQLYFGILLVEGQLDQNNLTKKDISTVMSKVEASIKNGTDFRTSLDKLNAELLKADQRDIELNATKSAFVNMLSLFIDKPLDENTSFEKPSNPLLSDKINRPELKIFEMQKYSSLLQKKMLVAKNIPKLNLFFQGGIGKPSPVNLFTRALSPYYITGLKLFWNIGGLYTLHKENLIADNDISIADIQEKTFLFNTSMVLTQQQSEYNKLNQLIDTDMQLIKLRESIKNTAEVQLENGVINTNDYLREVNAVDITRQNLVLHQIQLLQSSYNYNTTSGN